MNDLADPKHNASRIRDIVSMSGADRMRWLEAKERLAAEMRALVYELTTGLNHDIADQFKQWARDVRTRRTAGDGHFRFVEMLATHGRNFTRAECWRYEERMLTLERKAAELAFGPIDPGPDGQMPDDVQPATQPVGQVRAIRPFVMGSFDGRAWHRWDSAA